MFDAYDFFGKKMEVGDRVLFTTSAEGSSMTHGEIMDIYIPGSQYGPEKKKIKVRNLTTEGEPKMERKYVGGFERGDDRNWVEGKPSRASILDYYTNKFFKLSDTDVSMWDKE